MTLVTVKIFAYLVGDAPFIRGMWGEIAGMDKSALGSCFPGLPIDFTSISSSWEKAKDTILFKLKPESCVLDLILRF